MERCFFFFFTCGFHNAKNFTVQRWSWVWKSAHMNWCSRQQAVTQAFPTPHFEEHCTKNKQFCCFFFKWHTRFLTCGPSTYLVFLCWNLVLSTFIFTSKGPFPSHLCLISHPSSHSTDIIPVPKHHQLPHSIIAARISLTLLDFPFLKCSLPFSQPPCWLCLPHHRYSRILSSTLYLSLIPTVSESLQSLSFNSH